MNNLTNSKNLANDMYIDKSRNTICVSVKNISQFKELIEQANKEACQLQDTINKLENFNNEFCMNIDSTI